MTFFRDDLLRAQAVQRSFLPVLERARGGVEVAAEYRPAHAVGGDFYDVVHLRDGRVTALIGDVAGKGIAAALLMARVSTEFRRLASEKLGPRRILERVNAYLATQSLSDSFVTAACVQLQAARQQWVACNAGHVVPLLRRQTGELIALTRSSGLPLGLGLSDVPGADTYREDATPAAPGDVVVLMTDGILDGLGIPEGDGRDRIAQLLMGTPPELDAIVRTVFSAMPEQLSQRDDAAFLALGLTAAALPPPVERPRPVTTRDGEAEAAA
jgi:phosphoserine phosphatase RsbU/P